MIGSGGTRGGSVAKAHASGYSAIAVAVLAVFIFAPTAQAFLGLETGDVIDTIGFEIPSAGGVYTDNAGTDLLDITATADDITILEPAVLTEIQGGAISVHLDLVSESLQLIGDIGGGASYVYSYTATFGGRAGLDDISLYAPTGGPAPEQDGRLLATGEFSSDTVDVTIGFDTQGFLGAPTLTAGGTFEITGGDATFLSVFGMSGDFADFIAISTTSVPSITVLLADGYLFSERDTDLGGTGCGALTAGSFCGGSILTSDGDFVFSGNGEVQPGNASAFVPEPGTMALVVTGLLGALAAGRRDR